MSIYNSSILKLSPTPLSFFPKNEPIILHGNKMYFMNLENPEKNQFEAKFMGTNYSLIESESMIDLEKQYLSENAESINKLRDNYIKKIERGNNTLKQDRASLDNLLVNNNELDYVVKNYFFPITKRVNIETIVDNQKTITEGIKHLNLDQVKNIGFNHNTSYYNKFFKGDSFFVFKGSFYSIPKENINGNSIGLKNLRPISQTNNIDSSYKKFIEKEIKENVSEAGNRYLSILTNQHERINKLKSDFNHLVGSPERGYGAEKTSGNEYVLFKEVDKFIVEFQNQNYLFPSTKVGISLNKTGRGLVLGQKGFLYKDPKYNHPFVWNPDKNRRGICTVSDENTNRIRNRCGLGDGDSSPKDLINLVSGAKKLLLEAEYIVKSGHNSGHVAPAGGHVTQAGIKISKEESNRLRRRGINYFKKTVGD